MYLRYIITSLLLLLALTAGAQKRTTKTTKTTKTKKTTTSVKAPTSFPRSYNAAYYPDYYTFYDSSRNSYVYYQENGWKASPDRPAFMKDADMGKVRVQLLHDETLTTPEDMYQRYQRQYPATQSMPGVPVPIITISKERTKQEVR